jgi:hypothetical protein
MLGFVGKKTLKSKALQNFGRAGPDACRHRRIQPCRFSYRGSDPTLWNHYENRSRNPRRQRDHARQGPDGRPQDRIQPRRPQLRHGAHEAQEPDRQLRHRSQVFKADDKMDQVILDKKECTYSYFADPMYVCMDADYNQYEVEAENMGDALNYLEDGMAVEVVFYDGKAISVELPTSGRARNHLDRARRQGRHLRQGAQARQDRHRFRSAGAAVRLSGRQDRDRHPHRRIPQARLKAAGF